MIRFQPVVLRIGSPVGVAASFVRQLSDGNTAGSVLGRGATDLIAFYGATPIVQPAGNAEAAITRGQACGTNIRERCFTYREVKDTGVTIVDGNSIANGQR